MPGHTYPAKVSLSGHIEGGVLMRCARARALSPRSFLLLEHSLQVVLLGYVVFSNSQLTIAADGSSH